MITRWSIAAERVKAQGVVHVHRRPEPLPTSPRVAPGRHRGPRPVRIGRREYESVTAACRAHQVHPREIYQWVESGKAEFVS